MQQQRTVQLLLDDGSVFHGKSFGYEKATAGEVVFNTAMTGYPESLTDPSYSGQLMVLTYPLVGNYGVPPRTFEANGLATFMESEKIHAEAIIVSDYSFEYSHWNAVESLGSWLKDEKVAGIYGIDTRELTKLLREKGSMKGKIVFDAADEIDFVDPNLINQVDIVSCKEVITYGNGSKKVVLVDCGVKHNIIRCLLKRDVTVIRVPWNYDFTNMEYDGLFISNGPGDPDTCEAAVINIRKAMERNTPICGICMGNQLLAKAGGASIYKLKYGHRSHNQPVRMVGTERCFITSQNHGFAVDKTSLPDNLKATHKSLFDQTLQGIERTDKEAFGFQGHPEASPGPNDVSSLFDRFVASMAARR